MFADTVAVVGVIVLFTVIPKTGAMGVTAAGWEAGPVPMALVAATVQEYCTPFWRPISVSGEAGPALDEEPQRAMYYVIGEPPSETGRTNSSVTRPSPSTT